MTTKIRYVKCEQGRISLKLNLTILSASRSPRTNAGCKTAATCKTVKNLAGKDDGTKIAGANGQSEMAVYVVVVAFHKVICLLKISISCIEESV